MSEAGLYIHVPFCIQRCTYCDFFSCVASKHHSTFSPYKKNEAFVERVLNDVHYLKERFNIETLRTVYIGGGTPSLLACEDIIHLGTSIRQSQKQRLQEFTIEANPEDISADLLDAWKTAGISRVSVGVQSFNDTILANVNRRGSREKTNAALDLLFSRDFSVSLDLIAGLEGHTESILKDDIERALSYQPGHISLYELSDLIDIESEAYDDRAELFSYGVELLRAQGYRRYEVSNFARIPAKESVHNKIYWNLESYLGIAPGAVGTVIQEDYSRALRLSVRHAMDSWFSEKHREKVYDYEALDRNTLLQEYLMMGFRLFDGIQHAEFKRRFGRELLSIAPRVFERYEKNDMCRITSESLALNEKGMHYLNQFLIDIFAEET